MGNEDETTVADDVVGAYHRFRSADTAMHARVRAATGMGDNELRVVDYLVRAQRDGRDVMPSEVARHLGIASASTTALLDRLERSGRLERVSHPTDRRSILISATPQAEELLSLTVDAFEGRLSELTASLDDATRRHVIDFLTGLARAADATAAPTA